MPKECFRFLIVSFLFDAMLLLGACIPPLKPRSATYVIVQPRLLAVGHQTLHFGQGMSTNPASAVSIRE